MEPKGGPGEGGKNEVKDGGFHHSMVSVHGIYCNSWVAPSDEIKKIILKPFSELTHEIIML